MRTYCWFHLTIFFVLLASVAAKIYLTSVECRSLDKTFSDFEYCYLKAVNRSYKYISFKANLFKIPITNISMRFAFMKRANGYKPFLYDVKFDACEFLKKKNNPLISYFHNFFSSVSNMNHTCPYDHDIILRELGTDLVEEQTTILPFPEGDYGVFVTTYAYNIERTIIKFYGTIE